MNENLSIPCKPVPVHWRELCQVQESENLPSTYLIRVGFDARQRSGGTRGGICGGGGVSSRLGQFLALLFQNLHLFLLFCLLILKLK